MDIQARYTSSNTDSHAVLSNARAVYLRARQNAVKLLRDRRSRARTYAARCCQQARQEGFSLGYREGLEAAQAANLQSQICFDNALAAAKDECLKLVFALAHEIIGEEISCNSSALLVKIDGLLQHIPSTRILRIEVAPCQMESVRQELSLAFSERSIPLAASEEITPGDARVYTVSGIIELSWESHFKLLKEKLSTCRSS